MSALYIKPFYPLGCLARQCQSLPCLSGAKQCAGCSLPFCPHSDSYQQRATIAIWVARSVGKRLWLGSLWKHVPSQDLSARGNEKCWPQKASAGSGGREGWGRERKQVILVGNWDLLLLGHDGKEEGIYPRGFLTPFQVRWSAPQSLNSFLLYLFPNPWKEEVAPTAGESLRVSSRFFQ